MLALEKQAMRTELSGTTHNVCEDPADSQGKLLSTSLMHLDQKQTSAIDGA